MESERMRCLTTSVAHASTSSRLFILRAKEYPSVYLSRMRTPSTGVWADGMCDFVTRSMLGRIGNDRCLPEL